MRSGARPILLEDFNPAFDHLIMIEPLAGHPSRFAAYSAAVTAFGVLDSAFVPVGQTDTYVRNELRKAIAVKEVGPVAAVIRDLIVRKREVDRAWPYALGWELMDVVDLADDAAEHTDLSELQRHWLRIGIYAALVAFAPAGTQLPPVPIRKGQERHPTINLGIVPGDRPRTRYVDEDEDDDGAGVPVTGLRRR